MNHFITFTNPDDEDSVVQVVYQKPDVIIIGSVISEIKEKANKMPDVEFSEIAKKVFVSAQSVPVKLEAVNVYYKYPKDHGSVRLSAGLLKEIARTISDIEPVVYSVEDVRYAHESHAFDY